MSKDFQKVFLFTTKNFSVNIKVLTFLINLFTLSFTIIFKADEVENREYLEQEL